MMRRSRKLSETFYSLQEENKNFQAKQQQQQLQISSACVKLAFDFK